MRHEGVRVSEVADKSSRSVYCMIVKESWLSRVSGGCSEQLVERNKINDAGKVKKE